MKKRILAILIAVICLSCMFVFASCGGGGNDGGDDSGDGTKTDCSAGHSYGEWTTVTNESCTEAGLQKRVCSVCGDEEEQEIPAGHNWREWVTTTEATCEVAGLKTRECRECNETETAEIPAPGHEKEVTTEAKEPTFDTPGTTEGAKCKNCDYIYSVAVEIPAIGNIAKKDFVTVTQGSSWHSFETPMQYLFDGNPETAPNAPKGTPYALTFDLGDAYIYEITVVCNGMGKVYDAWNSKDVTEVKYNVKTVGITCYDKDGEVVAVQRWEELDINQQTSVKLEDINNDVATVEIYVESVGNNSNGDAYLWDINIVGTRQPTECEINGHTWSDWEDIDYVDCETAYTQKRVCSVCEKEETKEAEAKGHTWTEWGFDIAGDPFVKEPTCSESGYIGRMCTECGAEETEDQGKLEHEWTAWEAEGDCINGGERTRSCGVCGESETETIEAGNHINIVYEGAKLPTKEEDGSTGVKKCLACGTTLAGAKVLRIENIAKGGTVTTNPDYWALSAFFLKYLVDGDRETGLCTSPQSTSTKNTITFAEAGNVYEIVLVVNGTGSTSEGGKYEETTNNDYTISFILYDENDEVIFRSEQYQTLDKTEIVVSIELPEGTKAKSMSITRSKQAYIHENYLWEVEAFVLNEYSACDANGHDWSDWDTQEPVCSQTGLTDGYRSRRCDVCGELQEEVLPASHSFGDWNMTGFNCSTGGTKTRVCEDCGKVESETVPAGDHLNIELQDAIEPTLETDGYTGNYVCTACGETIETGKTIPKLANVALDATASTNSTFWAVVGNGSSWAPNTIPNINDGKLDTGANTMDGNLRNIQYILTWDNAVSVDNVIVVCNGTGNLGYKGSVENTNYSCAISIKIYNENGEVIKTVNDTTVDKTQIEVAMDTTASVTKIVVELTTNYNQIEGAIFEIIAVAPAQK